MTAPDNEVRLREATEGDVLPIVDVYVHSSNIGFEGRQAWKEADAGRIARWRRDLSPATPTRWWVAERSGRIVGFVGIGPSRDPVAEGLGEVDALAVAPEHWHTGVGKLLMRRALEGLREAGFTRAILWTLNGYPLGERFYVSTGWRRSNVTRHQAEQVRYDCTL